MQFTKEFKEALSHLPSKEKDKLILRLLKKDLKLANRLLFELVSEETIEQRREKVKQHLINKAKNTSLRDFSAGHLNMYVRYLSGDITEHVFNTKDKYGEVYLNLVMINEILKINNSKIAFQKYNSSTRKFCIAVISRAFKILILISKLHKDFWIELEEEVNQLGNLIGDNPHLMDTAIYNGFDVNWLLNFDIPLNISDYHKGLRQRGYLK